MKISIWIGNWLQQSRIPFETVVCFLYSWTYELTSHNWCVYELQMSCETAPDWNNYIREVCAAAMERHNETGNKMGSKGKIVRIDESVFLKHRNQAGRVFSRQWIFGGVCRETDKFCFSFGGVSLCKFQIVRWPHCWK